MDNALWIAMLVTAGGTLAMRMLPLLWMRRHLLLSQRNDLDGDNMDSTVGSLPTWLSVLGPLMIAAMFGVSLVPAASSFSAWLATAAGVSVTLLVWRRTRSLGWPVFAGVLGYGVVVALTGITF